MTLVPLAHPFSEMMTECLYLKYSPGLKKPLFLLMMMYPWFIDAVRNQSDGRVKDQKGWGSYC